MVSTTQAPSVGQPMTAEEFDEFLWQLDDERCINFELVGGKLKEMAEPSVEHQQLSNKLSFLLQTHIAQVGLDYEVLQQTICQFSASNKRRPDLIVVRTEDWLATPGPQAILRQLPLLAVEVISTNWKDDYIEKFALYQNLGIQEYWTIDSGRAKVRNPEIRVPTISVCILVNGKYQVEQYTGRQTIRSRLFPNFQLSIAQLFKVARIL